MFRNFDHLRAGGSPGGSGRLQLPHGREQGVREYPPRARGREGSMRSSATAKPPRWRWRCLPTRCAGAAATQVPGDPGPAARRQGPGAGLPRPRHVRRHARRVRRRAPDRGTRPRRSAATVRAAGRAVARSAGCDLPPPRSPELPRGGRRALPRARGVHRGAGRRASAGMGRAPRNRPLAVASLHRAGHPSAERFPAATAWAPATASRSGTRSTLRSARTNPAAGSARPSDADGT
jgi:hypothetical protein